MTLLPVRIFGDPVLRQKALPVVEFDAALRTFVNDLLDTMKAYEGVGLAANQVGLARRVVVVDVPTDTGPRAQHVLVNPVIIARSGSETGEEGCLSIPGIYEDVARSARLTVAAQNEHADAITIEAEGYLARAIQHEIDHLDGVLFVDRLSLLKRQFLRRALDALTRGELPEGYHPPLGG